MQCFVVSIIISCSKHIRIEKPMNVKKGYTVNKAHQDRHKLNTDWLELIEIHVQKCWGCLRPPRREVSTNASCITALTVFGFVCGCSSVFA